MSAQPAQGATQTGLSSIGKAMFVIGLVVLLGHWVYLGVRAKWKKQYGDTTTSAPSLHAAIPAEHSQQESTPVIIRVKAGEWSDWVFIMGRKVTIFPGNAKVEYELKGVNGSVRTVKNASDWKDDTQSQRFRADVNITYIVERL